MTRHSRSMKAGRMSALGAVCCLALQMAPAWGQVRPLHTRDVTRLSEVQVAEQLKRSDVIFVPIGSVETNAIMPSDQNYTEALGYAMAMAEETGGLYFPGLVHSFPGTTVIGSSSTYMTPSQGAGFLKIVARSLLRQGFRRQVYLSSGHGPAPLTGATLAREFFEETHVPILYIEMGGHLRSLNISREEMSKALYGLHLIAGRLIDLPVQGDYGAKDSGPAGPVPENEGLAKLSKMHYTGSLALGSWHADTMTHGGGRPLPRDAAEREAWGKEGAAQVRAALKRMQLNEAMAALKEHDEFTQKVIVPKFKKMLPTISDSLVR
jgi:creatinine amidohydrolase